MLMSSTHTFSSVKYSRQKVSVSLFSVSLSLYLCVDFPIFTVLEWLLNFTVIAKVTILGVHRPKENGLQHNNNDKDTEVIY